MAKMVFMMRTSIKLLFIVADEGARQSLLDMMAKSPIVRLDPTCSPTLEQGLALAANGRFDTVLMHWDLPDCHGLDALARLKEKAPYMPVTVLADNVDVGVMEKAAQLGAQNHIFRGHFDEVSLASFLQCAMERKVVGEMNNTLRVVNSILRHDVLNHLTVIGGSLEIYRMKKDEKFLNSATNAVDRSVDLIKKMKEVEMIISPKEMKRMDLHQVAEEVVRKHAGANVRFVVTGEGSVLADDALASVFDNIVSNALVHSASAVVRIDITEDRGEGLCHVRISDEGLGIPADVKPKIWQEGYKYGKSGQSGLGLFIVKKVMERYGGSVSVEDNKPIGTAFVLHLRCWDAVPA